MARGANQTTREQMDREWELIHPEPYSRSRDVGNSLLRATLLFGIGAIAVALFTTAMLDSRNRTDMARGGGLDFTSTGSIDRTGDYTLRRSVLSDGVCRIDADGSRRGAC